MDIKPDKKTASQKFLGETNAQEQNVEQTEQAQATVAPEVQEAIENGAIIEEKPTPRGFYGVDVVTGEQHLPAGLTDEMKARVVDWDIPPMMQQLISKAYGIKHPKGWVVREDVQEQGQAESEPINPETQKMEPEPQRAEEQGPNVKYYGEGEDRSDSIAAQEIEQTHGVDIDQARAQIEQAIKKGKSAGAHELSALAEHLHGEQNGNS